MSTATAPTARPPGDWLPLGPNRVRVLAGADLGDPIGAIEYEIAPGFAPPPVLHRHADVDSGWLVLDGAIDVSFDGASTERVETGGSITIPRACWFRWANPDPAAPARAVCWFSPAGFERFFPAAAAAAAEHLARGGSVGSFLPALVRIRAEHGDEVHPDHAPTEDAR